MSWLRSAVNRAVEVGGNTSIARTVRNYADSVVHHAGNAVAEGAKIIQDRIGVRNMQSFRLTMKRLEEVSVSCKGVERVQLLRRWLVALKEIERFTAEEQIISEDPKDSPKKNTIVYYVDPEFGTLNFRELFLYSQALEGITLSMDNLFTKKIEHLWGKVEGWCFLRLPKLFMFNAILEAPDEEEVSLLLELFRMCLTGRKEVHKAVISSIQDLAKVFSYYNDEVLVKREELLEYAQSAIAGLKVNADVARIDTEAFPLIEKIDKLKELHQPSNEASENLSHPTVASTKEDLEETYAQIQLCSTLEELLVKRRYFSNGDSPQVHAKKVDKLKVLSESLLNSTSKAEKRILEHRSQKEEAINFRVAKANEVGQLEKELTKEIGELEKQKAELEAQLKKVDASLSAIKARLRNAREERDNFDEASNQILMHLKVKEDELSRSIMSCRFEADVVNTWVIFLEDSWILRCAHDEQKEKQVNGSLEMYGHYFVNLVIHLLTTHKEQLLSSIIRIKGLAGHLHACRGRLERSSSIKDDSSSATGERKVLEEEYLALEAKFLTAIDMVDTTKMQFYTKSEGVYRKDDEKIKELFDALEKLENEFQSIERPVLEIEKLQRPPDSPGNSPTSKHAPRTPRRKKYRKNISSLGNRRGVVTQVDLDTLDSDNERDGRGFSSGEIEWEYDEFGKETNPSS